MNMKSKKFKSKMEQLIHFTGKDVSDCRYALYMSKANLRKASKKLKK